MTDSAKIPIRPPLTNSFDEVHRKISMQPEAETPDLETTGGKIFRAQAKKTRDGRLFIS
jgi:hypothetical protein